MPYLQGAYAQHSSLPSPTTTTLVSSRSLNWATRRYEFDDDGNFESMDDTAQRVMLAVSFGAGELPKFISDRELEKRRQRVSTSLTVLVDEGAITVRSVTAVRASAGRIVESVEFTNHHTGKTKTISRTTG